MFAELVCCLRWDGWLFDLPLMICTGDCWLFWVNGVSIDLVSGLLGGTLDFWLFPC